MNPITGIAGCFARAASGQEDAKRAHKPTVPQRCPIELIGVTARRCGKSTHTIDGIAGSQRVPLQSSALIFDRGKF
jgi:hypothetical protein